MRIAIPDWQPRQTMIYKGETTQWAQQYPHLVTVQSNGEMSPSFDMMKREAESMYRLAAPVEISPGVWFGHDDLTVSDSVSITQFNKDTASLVNEDRHQEMAVPSSRSSSKSSTDSIHTPTDSEMMTDLVSPVQLSSPFKQTSHSTSPVNTNHHSNEHTNNNSNNNSNNVNNSNHDSSKSTTTSNSNSKSNNGNNDDRVYNSFFHHIIRVRSNALPAVRADLEKHHLECQTGAASTNTATCYNPSVLSVAPWNPHHRATMITQLRDLTWYITRLVASRTSSTSAAATHHHNVYYSTMTLPMTPSSTCPLWHWPIVCNDIN
ncbi:hypothetical protein BDF22DRAFT_28315 [Syncephalis plumigaleata]|nr:hypothetical protein BDF22DRAFT_28315 [Syncephalis plumigaleata]